MDDNGSFVLERFEYGGLGRGCRSWLDKKVSGAARAEASFCNKPANEPHRADDHGTASSSLGNNIRSWRRGSTVWPTHDAFVTLLKFPTKTLFLSRIQTAFKRENTNTRKQASKQAILRRKQRIKNKQRKTDDTNNKSAEKIKKGWKDLEVT